MDGSWSVSLRAKATNLKSDNSENGRSAKVMTSHSVTASDHMFPSLDHAKSSSLSNFLRISGAIHLTGLLSPFTGTSRA